MGSARFNQTQTEPINPEDTMVSKTISLRASEQLSVLNTGGFGVKRNETKGIINIRSYSKYGEIDS